MGRYRLVTEAGTVVEGQEFDGIGLAGAAVEGRRRAILHRLAVSPSRAATAGGYLLQRLTDGDWQVVERLGSPTLRAAG